MSDVQVLPNLRERFDSAMAFIEKAGIPADAVTIDVTDYSHSVQVHPRGLNEPMFLAAIKGVLGEPTEDQRDAEKQLIWLTWGHYGNSEKLRVVMAVKVPR